MCAQLKNTSQSQPIIAASTTAPASVRLAPASNVTSGMYIPVQLQVLPTQPARCVFPSSLPYLPRMPILYTTIDKNFWFEFNFDDWCILQACSYMYLRDVINHKIQKQCYGLALLESASFHWNHWYCQKCGIGLFCASSVIICATIWNQGSLFVRIRQWKPVQESTAYLISQLCLNGASEWKL